MSNAILLAAEGGGGGFEAPGTSLFIWDPLFTVAGYGVTKPVILAFVSSALLIGFFWAAFAKPKLVPRGVQNVGEVGYVFIRDSIARQVIGKEGDRYVPFLFTIFFFVWVINIMAIIPLAQFPVASRIGIPAALSAIVWLVWVPLGMARQGGLGFFKNMAFPPGVPWPMYFLLAPIELISNLVVRPFTLAVRLFANMFAGHLLIAIFAVAAWHFLVEDFGGFFLVGVLGFVMTVVMTGFELLIQALQAFIFVLLTAVYIGGALHAEH